MNNACFYYYNDLIKLLEITLVILLSWQKRYSICEIYYFKFHKLLLPFICGKNIVSLANSLFGLSILISVHVYFLFGPLISLFYKEFSLSLISPFLFLLVAWMGNHLHLLFSSKYKSRVMISGLSKAFICSSELLKI